jgi:hypothetical protein
MTPIRPEDVVDDCALAQPVVTLGGAIAADAVLGKKPATATVTSDITATKLTPPHPQP